METLAERLTEQPWNEIGKGQGELRATADFNLMVDQLTSVLGVRLRDLMSSRRSSARAFPDEEKCDLKSNVRQNLRDYVACIGHMYRHVHYHSLEHATHVTLSANKLLDMMLQPQDMEECSSNEGEGSRHKRRVTLTHVPGEGVSLDGSTDSHTTKNKEAVREATFGISEDPMLRFALIFSCLVHDVDHQGVPNSTLVEEEDELAIIHNDSSVAEQNSLQVAFTLLARKEFDLLRKSIMPDRVAKKKFRKLVIDIVLVTDISNPERMQISQSKWMEAFQPEAEQGDEEESDEESFLGDSFSDRLGELAPTKKQRHMDKRGTVNLQRHSMYAGVVPFRRSQSERLGIRKSLDFGGHVLDAYSSTSEGEMRLRQDTVLDTLMNAADVAHTMQSFDVFVKWNERLFKELHAAYKAKRISWDPAEGWYGNQLWFYDAYVIPLAEKMSKCGVFGSRSSFFLCVAMENKRRWDVEGKPITEQLTGKKVDRAQREKPDKHHSGKRRIARHKEAANTA